MANTCSFALAFFGRIQVVLLQLRPRLLRLGGVQRNQKSLIYLTSYSDCIHIANSLRAYTHLYIRTHTHTHTHTHARTHARTHTLTHQCLHKMISRNQVHVGHRLAYAWFKKSPHCYFSMLYMILFKCSCSICISC